MNISQGGENKKIKKEHLGHWSSYDESLCENIDINDIKNMDEFMSIKIRFTYYLYLNQV